MSGSPPMNVAEIVDLHLMSDPLIVTMVGIDPQLEKCSKTNQSIGFFSKYILDQLDQLIYMI